MSRRPRRPRVLTLTPKPPREDLVGQTYGRLTVIGHAGHTQEGRILWRCACACGPDRFIDVLQSALKRQEVKSCGCLRRGGRRVKRVPEGPQLLKTLRRDLAVQERERLSTFRARRPAPAPDPILTSSDWMA